ncbi:MAG: single-stranded DNA-binding protein [Gemmataceae bacterium]|nr:single-stranded DNA-binding protein [Gemmataceae bacterium]
MANLNKVMLIGRLTRDPEIRTFPNGGKVAKFGLAVNNRRKNAVSGLWEDVPVFLDLEVFNRGENGRQADLVEQSLRKGHQVFVEGSLRMDQWTGQDGQKRSKLVVVVENFQFLERREGAGDMGSRPVGRPTGRSTGGFAEPPAAGGDA